MSDFPNGRPPGQNNIDATTERYVDPKNDPSANAVKPDSEQHPESGIEAQDETDPKVQAELADASKNFVEPSTAAGKQEDDEDELKPKQQPMPQATARTSGPAPKK